MIKNEKSVDEYTNSTMFNYSRRFLPSPSSRRVSFCFYTRNYLIKMVSLTFLFLFCNNFILKEFLIMCYKSHQLFEGSEPCQH